MKPVYNADGSLMNSGQLAAFNAFLAGRQFNVMKIYKFDLITGSSLYYSSADTDISYGGNTYKTAKPSGVMIETKGDRGQCVWQCGLEVNSMTFGLVPNGATINGQDFEAAVLQGVLDGAVITQSNAYWPTQAYTNLITPSGVVKTFAGRLGDINGAKTKYILTVNSHTELLNQNLPRNLFQAPCLNTLFDGACTLSAAAFKVSGTFGGGNSSNVLSATLGNATGYFDLGKIKFTSGANSGLWRSVKTYISGSPGSISIYNPLPNIPQAGDTFDIYPGCDKTQPTCLNKFSNSANFRATRFIPENSTGV